MKRHLLVGFFALAALFGQIQAQDLNDKSVVIQQSDTNFNVSYAQPGKIYFNIPVKLDYHDNENGSYSRMTLNSAMTHTLVMATKDNTVQSYQLNNIVTLLNHTEFPYA